MSRDDVTHFGYQEVPASEKARRVRCVSATFAWSDVGGWLALADHLPQDASGNWKRK